MSQICGNNRNTQEINGCLAFLSPGPYGVYRLISPGIAIYLFISGLACASIFWFPNVRTWHINFVNFFFSTKYFFLPSAVCQCFLLFYVLFLYSFNFCLSFNSWLLRISWIHIMCFDQIYCPFPPLSFLLYPYISLYPYIALSLIMCSFFTHPIHLGLSIFS